MSMQELPVRAVAKESRTAGLREQLLDRLGQLAVDERRPHLERCLARKRNVTAFPRTDT